MYTVLAAQLPLLSKTRLQFDFNNSNELLRIKLIFLFELSEFCQLFANFSLTNYLVFVSEILEAFRKAGLDPLISLSLLSMYIQIFASSILC